MANIVDSLKDIEEKQCSTYYSPIFNHNFKIYKDKTLVKLNPISKQDAKKCINIFAYNLPGKSYNTPFLNEKDFYEDPNFHQFYRFKTKMNSNLINIHFRTKSENKLVDKTLENINESFIIRECAESDYLDELLNKKYGDALNKIYKNEDLLNSREQELVYMKGNVKKRYIKHKSSMIQDTLSLMESEGHDPEETLKILQNIRIYPLIRCSNDLIVEKIKQNI